MALISIEDLAELDDEQLDDDVTDSSEPMDDEEQERLYAHWQAVGRTHQVSVPREMTGPITEMTRRNQEMEQERVPYTPISRHEKTYFGVHWLEVKGNLHLGMGVFVNVVCLKLGEVMYEERMYPAGKWACITKGEKMYEQSISMGFMKLMRYICKENSAGRYLGMTIPVVNEITMLGDGSGFVKDVVTAYYLPAEFQANTPNPVDPDITIIHRNMIRVITRVFFGTTTEETITREINLLWELLGTSEDIHRHTYMVAVYENPGVTCRRNEIWFIRRDP